MISTLSASSCTSQPGISRLPTKLAVFNRTKRRICRRFIDDKGRQVLQQLLHVRRAQRLGRIERPRIGVLELLVQCPSRFPNAEVMVLAQGRQLFRRQRFLGPGDLLQCLGSHGGVGMRLAG